MLIGEQLATESECSVIRCFQTGTYFILSLIDFYLSIYLCILPHALADWHSRQEPVFVVPSCLLIFISTKFPYGFKYETLSTLC